MLPISDSKFQGTEIKYTENKSKMQMLFNNKSQVSILSPLKDSANFQIKLLTSNNPRSSRNQKEEEYSFYISRIGS